MRGNACSASSFVRACVCACVSRVCIFSCCVSVLVGGGSDDGRRVKEGPGAAVRSESWCDGVSPLLFGLPCIHPTAQHRERVMTELCAFGGKYSFSPLTKAPFVS